VAKLMYLSVNQDSYSVSPLLYTDTPESIILARGSETATRVQATRSAEAAVAAAAAVNSR